MLSACQPAENTPTAVNATATVVPGETAQANMSDPFSYCASVGTIDQPDARYTGEAKPQSVIQGLMKASGVSSDIPVDTFSQGSSWRCMDGKVYACYVGANLPCDSKANTSQDPTVEISAYCEANPTADFIPASITGHDTIFNWKCQDGKAVAGDQVFHVDAQGYISEIWYPIQP